ncbi:MAG: Fe-S cluster assembly ATPase SufC [Acidimicrobiales bacterium]|nr:Fe-S cluster assembly ATPase SufC [Acidimicrobiales bacterium]
MANDTDQFLLEVEHLCVSAENTEILHDISLKVRPGEIHALLGPNGSGKSTLANVLMANPSYQVTSGKIIYKGEDITQLSSDVRAKAGIFLAFQHPEAIPGVPVHQFLRQAMSARRGMDISILEARIELLEWMEKLEMDPDFAKRPLNEGFSGGERKRHEVLQLALLNPELAILDETDSGLDIDALRIVAKGITLVKEADPKLGVLVITHYQRLLDYVKPDVVHVIAGGSIKETGGIDLVAEVDKLGYDRWLN